MARAGDRPQAKTGEGRKLASPDLGEAEPRPIAPSCRPVVRGGGAGVRVSPLQLGAMSIGDAWEKKGFGAMNKESSFKLLDAFYDAGGNFIDTANS